MLLATIRIRDTEVLSLDCPRLDARRGAALLELVNASVKRGTRTLVLDLGPETMIDFAGARAIDTASARLGGNGALVLAGLNARSSAFLRAVRIAEHVRLVEWWTDAAGPTAHAA